MALPPNPLLIELFESVCRELAEALERRLRVLHVCSDLELASAAEQRQRIAQLELVMNRLEGAFERRESRIVH